MQPQSIHFVKNAKRALQDGNLQQALGSINNGFVAKRQAAIERVENWEAIREAAKLIKDHSLAYLDSYLEQYQQQVELAGGCVHFATDAEEARQIVTQICTQAGAKTVTKGKSMVSEEVGLNQALIDAGMETIETDLGEYIIQLAAEAPSHIIAPAIHKTKEQISDLFQKFHGGERIEDRVGLVTEARKVLRSKFLAADVGITGANFLIAETGHHVLVTNEGNGDLTSCLPKTQIVISGIEKVLPRLEDASVMLKLLARSATGQAISNYTSFYRGPRGAAEGAGPEAFHVVLVDNGRSRMLGNEFKEMLRCIRCGACMNHCPVYANIGGHAYGWVYPGPMGAVITPNFIGIDQATDLPHACTLNGRCAEVCPMGIPLPALLRKIREKQAAKRGSALLLRGWAWLALHPRVYQPLVNITTTLAAWLSVNGRLRFPSPWHRARDLPTPEGGSFMQKYKDRNHD